MNALVHLLPIILLFAMIIGSIYNGWATPTEAAAVGVAGAFLIAGFFGGVSFQMISDSLYGTVKITSMIMLVVIGASFLNFTLASAGLGQELEAFLSNLGAFAIRDDPRYCDDLHRPWFLYRNAIVDGCHDSNHRTACC